MIHTDETGREFKVCARDACGQPFHQRPGEVPSKFQKRDYCSPRCRVVSNTQPAPMRKQVTVERSRGFVNPDGVWRPPGFPVYPGGIEIEGVAS